MTGELSLFELPGARDVARPAPVLAVVERDNADLMVDCHRLGYLDGSVLDVTVGVKAGFWRRWRPADLTTNDVLPTISADHHHDATALPFGDASFDSVVFDPPYKLNGTSTGRGASASDADYGVGGQYVPARDRHALLLDGTAEALRVARRYVLVKCQDQISSGRYNPQTFLVWDLARSRDADLVDLLHVVGGRPQPPGRRQLHAARNYSSLLVFRAPSP
jgi:hypothetical protein